MLNAVQDMWTEHEQQAQGVCGCGACRIGVDFFTAVCEAGEHQR